MILGECGPLRQEQLDCIVDVVAEVATSELVLDRSEVGRSLAESLVGAQPKLDEPLSVGRGDRLDLVLLSLDGCEERWPLNLGQQMEMTC